MKLRRFAQLGLFALMGVTAVSCSKTSVEQPTATHAVMPQDYSKRGVETLDTLAQVMPANTRAALFASYGSLTETIQTLKGWNLVQADELTKTLNDLGTHYKLDPSNLRSFYEAGFHTGKGFGIGLVGDANNIVLAAQILDESAFMKWFETFTTEEFGRPVSQTSEQMGWKMTQVNTLDEDFATVAIKEGFALIVFGAKVQGAPSNVVAPKILDALANHAVLASSPVLNSAKKQVGDAPLAVVISDPDVLGNNVVQRMSRSIGVGISPAEHDCHIRSGVELAPNEPYAEEAKNVLKAPLNAWNNPVIHAPNSSVTRVHFSPKAAMEAFMKYAPASYKKQWTSLTSKLKMPLLGLNFEQQVVQNLAGNLMVSVNRIDANTMSGNGSTVRQLLSQDVAVFLPIADVKLASKFFSKVAMFQKLIPPGVATIDSVEGVLHAAVKYQGATVHVGYADGLLSATTEAGWRRVLKMYASPDQSPVTGIFADASVSAVSSVASSDAVALLNGVCGPKCANITSLLNRSSQLDFTTSFGDQQAVVDLDVHFAR